MNPSSPIIGLAVVLLIIGLRWAYTRWKQARFADALKRGVDAMQKNDSNAAEAAFRECARLFPTSAQVRLALGAALAYGRKIDKAEEQFRFATQLEPRQPRGHLELGYFLALCAPERADDAVAAFTEAVKCSPQARDTLAKDPRLAALRQHAGFQALIEAR